MKINRSTFFKEVKKKLFKGGFAGLKGSGQIEGLDILINEWERRGDISLPFFAYILATAYHETAFTMQPIKEYGSDAYLKAKSYWPFVGRGYVQLTWKENYQKASSLYGVDFVASPSLLLKPEYAVKILFDGILDGWFTGKKLSDFINQGSKKEYENARRVVNGIDKKEQIAQYAIQFEKALRKAFITNSNPLKKSTTMPTGVLTTGAGAVVLVEPITTAVGALQGQQSALSSGNIIMLVVGTIIVLGSLYILYTRWDSAGRPKLW